MASNDHSRTANAGPYDATMPDATTSRRSAGRAVLACSVLIAVAATSALVVLGLALPPDRSVPLFEETGPFEKASPWLWLALALWIPLVFRRPTLGVAAGMVVSVAAAAREWDWHVAFTEYSVLKPPFYYRAEHPLHQQLIAGLVVAVIAFSVAVLVARLIRLRPWRRPVPWWAYALAFAFAMLVFTKVVDRAPAILEEDLGVSMGPRLRAVFYAVEEGLEMVLPAFFGAYALALSRWHAVKRGKETPRPR